MSLCRADRLLRLFFIIGLVLLDRGLLADDSFSDSPVTEESTDSVSVRLLYGESDGISWSDLSLGDRLSPLLSWDVDIRGLDYHYNKNLLFYSASNAIWRLNFDIHGAVESPNEIVSEVEAVTSIAIDWMKDRLYWISTENRTVERVDLDGNKREQVLSLGQTAKFSNFSNILIDPYTRFLFLALDGNRFIRSNINGGGVSFVEPDGLKDKRVVSLAIDRNNKRLFVSSRHDYVPHITSCDYDGSKALEYDLSDAWWHSFLSIDVFKDQLFWVHSGWQERDAVWKAKMTYNGSLSWDQEYTVPQSSFGYKKKIWTLKVYHPDVQRSKKRIEKYNTEETEFNDTPSAVMSVSSSLRQQFYNKCSLVILCTLLNSLLSAFN